MCPFLPCACICVCVLSVCCGLVFDGKVAKLNELVQSVDRNGQHDGDVDEPADDDKGGRVGVGLDGGHLEEDNADDEESDHDERTYVLPGGDPEAAGTHLEHLVYVGHELLAAVEPRDRDGLEEHDEHESGRRAERVQEGDQVHAAVGDGRQRADEEYDVYERHEALAIALDGLELVGERGVDSLEAAEARVEAEINDHEKEYDGEERRVPECGEYLRIGNEREAHVLLCHVLDRLADLVAQVAERGEHDHARQEARHRVRHAREHGVDLRIVVKLRIAGVGGQHANARSKGEEYLNSRVLNMRIFEKKLLRFNIA